VSAWIIRAASSASPHNKAALLRQLSPLGVRHRIRAQYLGLAFLPGLCTYMGAYAHFQ